MHKIITVLLLFLNFGAIGQSTFDTKGLIDLVNNFTSSLTETQKPKVLRSWSDTSRTRWSNLPLEQWGRDGLRLDDLTDEQRIKLHDILRSILSDQGYLKILYIMHYDQETNNRLTSINSPIAHRYGQEKYWTWIFGNPSSAGIWGFKFEGHHISINMTFSPRGISCTPHFTGINPGLTTKGITAGKYVLYRENESGKKLFNSLSELQRKRAHLDTLPFTIDVRAQSGKESFLTDETGLKYSEMNAKQQDLVWDIVTAWVENFNSTISKTKLNTIKAGLSQSKLIWLGTSKTQELHYYCIKGPGWIIEFTNRDQGLQHFHTLWRMMPEDFGIKL